MKKLNSEQEQLIIKMYQDGSSIHKIHLDTQFAVMTIKSVLARNNVPHVDRPTVLDKYTTEEIYDYYINHTVVETQKHFGCNIGNVYIRIKGLPLKDSKTFFRCVNQEEFKKLYADHTVEEVAKYYGITNAVVRNTAIRLKATKSHKAERHYRHNVITPQNFTEKQREMVKYLAEKYSGEDIAILLGKTSARICQILGD